MAHPGSISLLQNSAQQPTVLGRNLRQQLTPRTSPFLLEHSRLTGRSRSCTVVSAGAAVAFPASYPDVGEVGRTLLRTTSTGLSGSAEMLKRTLSGKVISAPEDVIQVHSPEELQEMLERHQDKLVVLMCKAMACRPCKMFARKYSRIAAEYASKGAVFLEILGDESAETRKLMIAMQIRVTPTFCLFRQKEVVKTVTGVNVDNLQNAVREQLQPAQNGSLS